MASSKREKELARMRAERQAARRAAAAARRRQRQAIVASVIVAALIATGAIVLATKTGSRQPDLAASPQASTSASASTDASAKPGTCSYTKSTEPAAKKIPVFPPTDGVELTQKYDVTLTTNLGPIVIRLNTPEAPCTANNFRALSAFKYFDNTPCHRLTTQGIYVLQCGDPTGKGTGGPGYTFADENLKGATYPQGTVAMANSGPGTNGSQFFLVYKDTQLDPNYTPFGTIVSGLDLIEKVAAAGSTPEGDGKPKTAVTIKTARARPTKA